MAFVSWLLRLLQRWTKEPADQAYERTLRLQLNSLALRFRTIDPQTLRNANEQAMYAELADIFARWLAPFDPARSSEVTPTLTWDDAYRIESQIACLLQGERLRQEITSRLRWAKWDKVPQAADFEDDYAALLKRSDLTDDVSRDFLLTLMAEIHWHSMYKFISRKMRGQATRRTLGLGFIALLVALSPYLLLPSILQSGPGIATVNVASLDGVLPIAFFGSYELGAHFALLSAVTFGLLGAVFSRLIALQTQWRAIALEELYNARSYSYIVLRASIGVVGALVVYFFLQSGLVKGSVFPEFNNLTMTIRSFQNAVWPTKMLMPSANLALLIMWSFVAGFSESLVPTVLSNTERQFAGALNARP